MSEDINEIINSICLTIIVIIFLFGIYLLIQKDMSNDQEYKMKCLHAGHQYSRGVCNKD